MKRSWWWRVAAEAAALFVFLPGMGASETPAPGEAPPAGGRHRVALVLSGGGARGAAHIGVLRVLEELHVVPDLVVGTSIGSIVGGLYASGWLPGEIEDLVQSIDWNALFSDRIERGEKSFRRKQDDAAVFVKGKVRFRGVKPYLPGGIMGGQRLELLLRSLEMVSTDAKDFDSLPIPFRAVAVDIRTGEAVVLDSGSLATAMRASMAIPGAFGALEVAGRTLADGGAVANLPVRAARDAGADVIIAVDVTTPLDELPVGGTTFLQTLNRMSDLLTYINRLEDERFLTPADVLLRPQLGDLSFLDFDRAAEGVLIGEAAARARIDDLRRWSADEREWEAFAARRRRFKEEPLVVNNVHLTNTSQLDDAVVLNALAIRPGKPLDVEGVSEALMRLSAIECFGIITDRFERHEGQGILFVDTPDTRGGKGSLQVGVNFTDDLEGDVTYGLTLRHQLLPLNHLGGEWQNVVALGSTFLASTELYQPLEATMTWFASAGASLDRTQQRLWIDGEAVAEYQLKRAQARATFGRVLGDWGDVSVGIYSARHEGERRIGMSLFPEYREDRGGFEAALLTDTFDDRVFPRSGTLLRASFERSVKALGADLRYRRVSLAVSGAFSWGKNTLAPALEIGANLESPVSVTSAFHLGGPGRLSGLGRNELWGEDVGLARLIYYRRLAGLDIASLRVRAYVGASLEAGNVFDEGEGPVTVDSLLVGGGPFVGADTPIGPVLIGLGYTEGKRRHVYVMIGESF